MVKEISDQFEMLNEDDLNNCCRLYREFFATIKNPPEHGDRHEEIHRCPFCGEQGSLLFVRLH